MINESDHTLALQDVVSYGTEGRTSADAAFPASPDVHKFLKFRGSDIKDLHVHDANAANASKAKAKAVMDRDDAVVSVDMPPSAPRGSAMPPRAPPQPRGPHTKTSDGGSEGMFDNLSTENGQGDTRRRNNREQNKDDETFGAGSSGGGQQRRQGGNNNNKNAPQRDNRNNNRNNNNNNNNRAPRDNNAAPRENAGAPRQPRDEGTMASLAGRKARGVVSGGATVEVGTDFDLEAAGAAMTSGQDADDDDDAFVPSTEPTYKKDDFFDSLSCDQTDKANGVNNRLRGAEERDLNMEAFGAVSLGGGSRRGGGRRNGGGGRGGGRGGDNRGRGGGQRRTGGGGRGGNRNRYSDSDGMPKQQSTA
jgi:protein LSM14